jgi:hypothetical protein
MIPYDKWPKKVRQAWIRRLIDYASSDAGRAAVENLQKVMDEVNSEPGVKQMKLANETGDEEMIRDFLYRHPEVP